MDLLTVSILNERGFPQPNCKVHVYEAGTPILAATFDEDGAPIDNPLTTDEFGFCMCQLPNGKYDYQVKYGDNLLKHVPGYVAYDPDDDPGGISDGSLTLGKLENLASMTVVGNVEGFGAPAVEVDVLDENDMASDRGDALATQQSIKAYIDAALGALSIPDQYIKAFGTFDGTGSNGAKSVTGLNASAAKVGDGEFTITFDAPLPNANYTVVPGGLNNAAGYLGCGMQVEGRTTNGFTLRASTGAGSTTSGDRMSFAVLAV